jgi:hypothetical protein
MAFVDWLAYLISVALSTFVMVGLILIAGGAV